MYISVNTTLCNGYIYTRALRTYMHYADIHTYTQTHIHANTHTHIQYTIYNTFSITFHSSYQWSFSAQHSSVSDWVEQ